MKKLNGLFQNGDSVTLNTDKDVIKKTQRLG